MSLVLAVATAVVIPETLPAHARQRGGLRATGRAFLGLARDRAFAGYALTVAFAYASLFGYIAGSSFALQDLYGLSATQFSLVFALNAAGSIVLGLLNARLVKRYPVHRLLVVGLLGSTVAAVLLLVTVAAGAGLVAVLLPLFVVVASRGPGVRQRDRARHRAVVRSRIGVGRPGCLMFAGGVLVTPLLAAGGEGTALPMAAVVAGGAVAALLATVLLARPAAKA